MTKEIIHQLSNEEILEYVNNLNKKPDILNQFLKNHHRDVFDEIVLRTSFLDAGFYAGKSTPIKARLYCLSNNITVHPRCQNPHCPVNGYVEWRSKTQSFALYCCRNCCYQDEEHWKRQQETNNRLYGGNSPFCSKQVRDTYETNMLKTRGVRNPFQLEQVKEKIKTQNLEHLGVEYPMQSEAVKSKARETFLSTLGVDNPFKSELIKEKIRKRNKDKIGVENPMQSEDIKLKVRQRNLEKYNVEWTLQSDEVRNKYKLFCQQLGVDHYSQSEEFKTHIKTTWESKSESEIQAINDQRQNTMDKLYGVKFYSQTSEFHKRCHKCYTNPKYPDMTFDRSWEFKVYDFLTEHNIPFEYQPSISIPYECEETHHTYHPDFLVNGRLYEVKGDNFFRINEETGKEEMYLTWKGDLSDEEYEWRCKVMEAKHQCMIAHNVIILRKAQIENLDSVFLVD